MKRKQETWQMIERLKEQHGFPDPQDHIQSLPFLIRLVERAKFQTLYQKQYVLYFFKIALENSLPTDRRLDKQTHPTDFPLPELDAWVIDESHERFGQRCAVVNGFPATRTFDVVFADRQVVRLRSTCLSSIKPSEKSSESSDVGEGAP
jgi:hypothetical protein